MDVSTRTLLHQHGLLERIPGVCLDMQMSITNQSTRELLPAACQQTNVPRPLLAERM